MVVFIVLSSVATGLGTLFNFYFKQLEFKENENRLTVQAAFLSADLKAFKEQDQVKINKQLKEEVDQINKTYNQAVSVYQDLLDLKVLNSKTSKDLDTKFASSLKLLSDRNYLAASSLLIELDKNIQEETDKIKPLASKPSSPGSAPSAVNNTPPQSGYSRQAVQTDKGTFNVDIISADLNTTKVIVDTASDSDCSDNCPVLSLGDYVSRNGAFAGINGSYFCPEAYPQCAGKTNSFDTLLMNKNKHYFNSNNNVYSVVPAVIFNGNSVRFVGRSLEWGRDTGVDAVIANYPLLVQNGNIVNTDSSDSKLTSRGPRCFIANKGNTVYIGIVYGADLYDQANVLKTLGMENALNLDEGGSTALWYGGSYRAGPGRNIPNAVLFVKR